VNALVSKLDIFWLLQYIGVRENGHSSEGQLVKIKLMSNDKMQMINQIQRIKVSVTKPEAVWNIGIGKSSA
jgi:hypothetical protein